MSNLDERDFSVIEFEKFEIEKRRESKAQKRKYKKIEPFLSHLEELNHFSQKFFELNVGENGENYFIARLIIENYVNIVISLFQFSPSSEIIQRIINISINYIASFSPKLRVIFSDVLNLSLMKVNDYRPVLKKVVNKAVNLLRELSDKRYEI